MFHYWSIKIHFSFHKIYVTRYEARLYIMFCADYIATYIYHAVLTIGLLKFTSIIQEKKEDLNDVENVPPQVGTAFAIHCLGLGHSYKQLTDLCHYDEFYHIKYGKKKFSVSSFTYIIPAVAGMSCGLAASLTLYPVDFVRGGVLQSGFKRLLSAGSTIPYAGTMFGVYFANRDPNNFQSQFTWATGACTCGLLAEVPFDYAKRTMLGSTRFMLGIGILYVPFAAGILVMYDKAAIKIVDRYISS